MNKFLRNIVVPFLALPLFFSCSKDDVNQGIDESELNSSGTVVEPTAFTATDLVGTWEIVSMTSDVAVNLDFNETSSTNVLSETSCFDNMFFTFAEDGTITTGQAKLDFGANGNKFECGYGEYSAKYEINGNELVITFVLDGTQMTQSKTISLTSNPSGEYLNISLEDYEAAQYVDDPGNTVASDVERIETVYKKQ